MKAIETFSLDLIRKHENVKDYSYKVEVTKTESWSSVYLNFHFPKTNSITRVFQVHLPDVNWKENLQVKMLVNFLNDKKNKIIKDKMNDYFFNLKKEYIENSNISLYSLYKDYIPFFDKESIEEKEPSLEDILTEINILQEQFKSEQRGKSKLKENFLDLNKEKVEKDLLSSPIILDELDKWIVINKIFLKDNDFYIYNVKSNASSKLKVENISTDFWVYKNSKDKQDLVIIKYIEDKKILLTLSKLNKETKELEGKIINCKGISFSTNLQLISKVRLFDLNGETFLLIVKDTTKDISTIELLSLKDNGFNHLETIYIDSLKTDIYNKLKDDKSMLKILDQEKKDSNYLNEIYWIVEIESKEYLYLNYQISKGWEGGDILFLTDGEKIKKQFNNSNLINKLTQVIEGKEITNKVGPTITFWKKEYLIIENKTTFKNFLLDSDLELKEELEKGTDKILDIIKFENYNEEALLTLEKDLKTKEFKYSVIDKNWFEIIDKSSIYPNKIYFKNYDLLHCEEGWLQYLKDAYGNNLIFEYGIEYIEGIVYNSNIKYIKYKDSNNETYYIDEWLNILTEREFKGMNFDWESSYISEDKRADVLSLKLLDKDWKEAPLFKNKKITYIKKINNEFILIWESLKSDLFAIEVPEYVSKNKYSLFSKNDLYKETADDLFWKDIDVITLAEKNLVIYAKNSKTSWIEETNFLGFAYTKKEEVKKYNWKIQTTIQAVPTDPQFWARLYKGLIELSSWKIFKFDVQFISKPRLICLSTNKNKEEEIQENGFWKRQSDYEINTNLFLELSPYDTNYYKFIYCEKNEETKEFNFKSIFDKECIKGKTLLKYYWKDINTENEIESKTLFLFKEELPNSNLKRLFYYGWKELNPSHLKEFTSLWDFTDLTILTTKLKTEEGKEIDKVFAIYKKNWLDYFSVIKIENEELVFATPEIFKNGVFEISKEIITEYWNSKTIKYKETERSSYSSVEIKASPNRKE